ncbi:MAG: class I SAM-dependent methyltransferase [Desulfobacteraceae bacterium]|jgi:ubiquinone/menaquinone biosynthesis C-methylase UbiE|nr:MAG: class I SAM-dependent methyltransferase [Desulfobacteraceae bacterium]
MGIVFDAKVAADYKSWQKSRQGLVISGALDSFILTLLNPKSGERVLDIGCGFGDQLLFLRKKGMNTTGVDPSPHMLDCARARLGQGCTLEKGYAEDLPFEDNEFDVAMLINTLEFLDDPSAALREAARVASKRIVVAAINRWSPGAAGNRIKSFFGQNIYSKSRFYSLWRLKGLIKEACGTVPISWASISGGMTFLGPAARMMGAGAGVGQSPFGVMVGVSATLVYRFRTEPLALPVRLKSAGHTAA